MTAVAVKTRDSSPLQHDEQLWNDFFAALKAGPKVKPMRSPAAVSSDFIERTVSRLMQDAAGEAVYNRLFQLNDFLEYFEDTRRTHPSCSMKAAFATYDANPASIDPCDGNAHCVGMAEDLEARMAVAGIRPDPVPAQSDERRTPGEPRINHLGLILPFANPDDPSDCGYAIMEPGYFMTRPVIIRHCASQIVRHGDNTWRFDLEETASGPALVWYNAADNVLLRRYWLRHILNAGWMSLPILVLNTRPVVVRFGQHGAIASLVAVEVEHERVVCRIGNDKQVLTFAEIRSRKGSDWLPCNLMAPLKMDAAQLDEQVRRVMRHGADLCQLAQAMLASLHEAGLTLAGPIP